MFICFVKIVIFFLEWEHEKGKCIHYYYDTTKGKINFVLFFVKHGVFFLKVVKNDYFLLKFDLFSLKCEHEKEKNVRKETIFFKNLCETWFFFSSSYVIDEAK